MKKATVADMEMGNLLFGNSRGTYLIEPREEFQNAFVEFLDNNGFDTYGYHENDNIPFETDVFSIRPYYWGDDEEIATLPNFVFKPKGIEISWYKYPMRDAYCSHDISLQEFKDILAECAKSMAK